MAKLINEFEEVKELKPDDEFVVQTWQGTRKLKLDKLATKKELSEIALKEGERGEKGDKGDKGDKGEKGEKGEQGIQGIQGLKGDTGAIGPVGQQGQQGIRGEQGQRGVEGKKGDTGERGEKGDKGDKGDTGPQGPVGPLVDTSEFENRVNAEISDIANKVNDFDKSLSTSYYTDETGKRKEFNSANERVDYDVNKLQQQIYDSSLVEYSGSSIKADNTYYGRTEELKIEGRTLQNLWRKENIVKSNQLTLNNDSVTLRANSNYVSGSISLEKTLIKPNTTYTYIVDIIDNSLNGIFIAENSHSTGASVSSSKQTLPGETGVYRQLIKTKADFTDVTIGIRTHVMNSCTEGEITYRMTILEGDFTNVPLSEIPYGEGIYSVGEQEVTPEGKYSVKLKSTGKNLIKDRLIADMKHSTGRYITIDNGSHATAKSIIYLKPGVYSLSIDNFDTGLFVDASVWIWKKDLLSANVRKSSIQRSFEILDDEVGITWYGGVREEDAHLISNLIGKSFQVECGERTTYQPYQESTYETLLDEPLRSLRNGVADTRVGKVETRRVGEVIVDKNWNTYINSMSGDDDTLIRFNNSVTKIKHSTPLYCNLFPYFNIHSIGGSNLISFECVYPHNGNAELNIIIKKSRLVSPDVDGFKQWLSENPLIIYCELAEPIITIHEDIPQLTTFEGTTHITSENYLPANINVKVPSNLSAMLQESRAQTRAVSMQLEETQEELENTKIEQEETNLNILAQTWDTDYRLCELEWALEDIANNN